MKLREALDAISTNGQPAHIYSQPYETADGTTVIAVSKVRGRLRPASGAAAAAEEIAVRAKPIGVFAIRNGEVKFSPAVDATPIAFVGVLTGFVSATLAMAAVIRRPPWPELKQVRRFG